MLASQFVGKRVSDVPEEMVVVQMTNSSPGGRDIGVSSILTVARTFGSVDLVRGESYFVSVGPYSKSVVLYTVVALARYQIQKSLDMAHCGRMSRFSSLPEVRKVLLPEFDPYHPLSLKKSFRKYYSVSIYLYSLHIHVRESDSSCRFNASMPSQVFPLKGRSPDAITSNEMMRVVEDAP